MPGERPCDGRGGWPGWCPLREAVAELVHDGDTRRDGGVHTPDPVRGGAHEVIRQQRRDLALVRMTPDLIYDQVIGMGCAGKLIFSWGGNPGVGSLHRFRDAVNRTGWPMPLEVEEHSHAGMANRLRRRRLRACRSPFCADIAAPI